MSFSTQAFAPEESGVLPERSRPASGDQAGWYDDLARRVGPSGPGLRREESSMRVRPFGSERFLIDVRQGDILAESGDVLVTGRPKGLRSPAHRPVDAALWRESDLIRRGPRRPLQYSGTGLPWRSAYAFPYTPKGREHLPDGSRDLSALRYYLVRNDLELLLLGAWNRERERGELKVGLAPLSWRRPEVVAHLMAEALAGLFFCVRDDPRCKSLTVVVRSLDEPRELARVFDRDYFKAWRRRLGWPPALRDVWRPA
jgi:hypothetical protein